MTSPYINTQLTTSVSIDPVQMDNEIYIYLKRNLEAKILNKCYKEYGFVVDIFKILDYSDAVIPAENYTASARFGIKFSCKLCRPISNTQIIAKINRANRMLITANNGPISIIITNSRKNDEIFFFDNAGNLRYKKDNESFIIKSNDFVKVKLLTANFKDKDEKINAIGFLEDMATDKEVELFSQDLFDKGDDSALVSYANYIKQ